MNGELNNKTFQNTDRYSYPKQIQYTSWFTELKHKEMGRYSLHIMNVKLEKTEIRTLIVLVLFLKDHL